MNIMTLQRYKNEIILLITMLFALFAFIYKLSATTYVEENQLKIQQQINEVTTVVNLKKQWNGKGIAKKIKIFKSIVPSSKVKLFKQKSKKLVASYTGLTAKELNIVNKKLLNMPIQIINLAIVKSAKNQYTMEFTCKW